MSTISETRMYIPACHIIFFERAQQIEVGRMR